MLTDSHQNYYYIVLEQEFITGKSLKCIFFKRACSPGVNKEKQQVQYSHETKTKDVDMINREKLKKVPPNLHNELRIPYTRIHNEILNALNTLVLIR